MEYYDPLTAFIELTLGIATIIVCILLLPITVPILIISFLYLNHKTK
jgi:hypothetical protein